MGFLDGLFGGGNKGPQAFEIKDDYASEYLDKTLAGSYDNTGREEDRQFAARIRVLARDKEFLKAYYAHKKEKALVVEPNGDNAIGRIDLRDLVQFARGYNNDAIKKAGQELEESFAGRPSLTVQAPLPPKDKTSDSMAGTLISGGLALLPALLGGFSIETLLIGALIFLVLKATGLGDKLGGMLGFGPSAKGTSADTGQPPGLAMAPGLDLAPPVVAPPGAVKERAKEAHTIEVSPLDDKRGVVVVGEVTQVKGREGEKFDVLVEYGPDKKATRVLLRNQADKKISIVRNGNDGKVLVPITQDGQPMVVVDAEGKKSKIGTHEARLISNWAWAGGSGNYPFHVSPPASAPSLTPFEQTEISGEIKDNPARPGEKTATLVIGTTADVLDPNKVYRVALEGTVVGDTFTATKTVLIDKDGNKMAPKGKPGDLLSIALSNSPTVKLDISPDGKTATVSPPPKNNQRTLDAFKKFAKEKGDAMVNKANGEGGVTRQIPRALPTPPTAELQVMKQEDLLKAIDARPDLSDEAKKRFKEKFGKPELAGSGFVLYTDEHGKANVATGKLNPAGTSFTVEEVSSAPPPDILESSRSSSFKDKPITVTGGKVKGADLKTALGRSYNSNHRVVIDPELQEKQVKVMDRAQLDDRLKRLQAAGVIDKDTFDFMQAEVERLKNDADTYMLYRDKDNNIQLATGKRKGDTVEIDRVVEGKTKTTHSGETVTVKLDPGFRNSNDELTSAKLADLQAALLTPQRKLPMAYGTVTLANIGTNYNTAVNTGKVIKLSEVLDEKGEFKGDPAKLPPKLRAAIEELKKQGGKTPAELARMGVVFVSAGGFRGVGMDTVALFGELEGDKLKKGKVTPVVLGGTPLVRTGVKPERDYNPGADAEKEAAERQKIADAARGDSVVPKAPTPPVIPPAIPPAAGGPGLPPPIDTGPGIAVMDFEATKKKLDELVKAGVITSKDKAGLENSLTKLKELGNAFILYTDKDNKVQIAAGDIKDDKLQIKYVYRENGNNKSDVRDKNIVLQLSADKKWVALNDFTKAMEAQSFPVKGPANVPAPATIPPAKDLATEEEKIAATWNEALAFADATIAEAIVNGQNRTVAPVTADSVKTLLANDKTIVGDMLRTQLTTVLPKGVSKEEMAEFLKDPFNEKNKKVIDAIIADEYLREQAAIAMGNSDKYKAVVAEKYNEFLDAKKGGFDPVKSTALVTAQKEKAKSMKLLNESAAKEVQKKRTPAPPEVAPAPKSMDLDPLANRYYKKAEDLITALEGKGGEEAPKLREKLLAAQKDGKLKDQEFLLYRDEKGELSVFTGKRDGNSFKIDKDDKMWTAASSQPRDLGVRGGLPIPTDIPLIDDKVSDKRPLAILKTNALASGEKVSLDTPVAPDRAVVSIDKVIGTSLGSLS